MKKRAIVTIASTLMVLGLAGTAQAAPGADIQDACGASFGALISAGKSGGTATHANYAGGAAAFADPSILAAHGCG